MPLFADLFARVTQIVVFLRSDGLGKAIRPLVLLVVAQ